jgi:hypothetical protein
VAVGRNPWRNFLKEAPLGTVVWSGRPNRQCHFRVTRPPPELKSDPTSTLVAHIAPRGSIQGVSAERETSRMGSIREASVMVRVAANTGYQLMVRGTAVADSRIWVRGVDGEFQELTAGSSVTVARGTHAAGQWDREVQYRIESAGDLNSLPVRYEIALSPQL